MLRFDAKLAGLEADDFVEHVLVGALRAKRVVIGEGFRFGRGARRRRATAAPRRRGMRLCRRRRAAAHGRRTARELDARARGARARSDGGGEDVAGTRLQDQRARHCGREARPQLGFRTANMRLHRRVSPVAGIFAVRVSGAGSIAIAGVASVGTRPTVGGTEWLLEVARVRFRGRPVRHAARRRLRRADARRDPVSTDVEAMTAQMHEDARLARASCSPH